MHLIPKSSNAQGACSLEDPQPKFFPVIKIFDLLNGSLFNIKSSIFFPLSSYLISKKRFFPSPVLFIVFKNCFGITCVISSSYADIFYNNCFKNGILPITISEEEIKELSNYSVRKEEISIVLEDQKILFGNKEIKFEIDQFKKKCLIEGLDDIALSLEQKTKIEIFEKDLKSSKPWIFND